MKKNTRLPYMVLILIFLGSFSSQAQPPAGEGPMGPPPEMSTAVSNEENEICSSQQEWMKKKLKLSREQQAAVQQITRQYVKKMLALKKKDNYQGSNDPGKILADRERDEALRKILTPKQFTRFDKNKHVLDNSFEITAGGMPPPPPMN